MGRSGIPDSKSRIEDLEARLLQAEETLRAIRNGEVDALVISGTDGEQIYTLKTAEHPYRVLIEAINEGAVTLNSDGTVLFCNRSFAELVQSASGQILGHDFRRFVAAADLPRFDALMRQSPLKNSKGEIALVMADRREVPVLLSLSRLPQDDCDGVSIVVTDLTQQKQQQELAASESVLRSILDQAAEATVVCDERGQVIHASRRANELCGGNALLRPFDEAFPLHKGWQSEARLNFSNILQSEDLRGVEAQFRRPDGAAMSLLLSAGLVFDLNERMIGCVVTMIDITDRKRTEEDRQQLLARERAARAEAEEANRLKDEFLATVSHELRTPLNAIFGWTSLLRQGTLTAETSARAIEVIDRNARFQAQLIEDLLDISRIITGQMRLDIQLMDPALVIGAAFESVRPAAEAKGVKLLPFLDSHAGAISGDTNRVQQIVWNLLSNAIKFTPRGGEVRLQLERTDSHVEIRVSDTGKGISPEFLPFVFDRFRQADSSSTRLFSGLGLGLAIVRHLTELHGGSVEVHSEGDGKGATFSVRLPLADLHHLPDEITAAPDTRMSKAQSAGESPDMNGVRLLIVDDEPDTRELLAHRFTQCGAEVQLAASAEEGLAIFKAWNPVVLVSDIGMPGGDGYRLIHDIRNWESDHGGSVPAIALTAYARREDERRALATGFQMHVSKPVEKTAELLAMVMRLVQQESNSS